MHILLSLLVIWVVVAHPWVDITSITNSAGTQNCFIIAKISSKLSSVKWVEFARRLLLPNSGDDSIVLIQDNGKAVGIRVRSTHPIRGSHHTRVRWQLVFA